MEYRIRCPSHSRRTRSSPKTRLNSGFSDSKSISVSLTSKIRTEGFPPIHRAWSFWVFVSMTFSSRVGVFRSYQPPRLAGGPGEEGDGFFGFHAEHPS